MKRSYRDRDYSFGQTMLNLRSAIGLTQVGLAKHLGISRFAVGEWEAGNKYPKAEHLRKFIALAFEYRAFQPGREVEEIRLLWQAAHQKVLLNETWLAQIITGHKLQVISPVQPRMVQPVSNPELAHADLKAPIALPMQGTSFVGRSDELSDIAEHLRNPVCRLLTLVGPGGMGKTRLAIQVAANCADQFDDGVYFVPLQPLASPEFIVSAIADIVGFQFQPGGDLNRQLFEYLHEKSLLLLLDNFEHLLDGAELLTEILAVAPELKLLVTSREVLNLQEEWLYPVHGLNYPERDNVEQLGSFSAVQLFIERARHVGRNLSLADEQRAVVRICQLVEGMPLALELASTWARTLPTNEIATEIQRSLEFLSTSLRNVPRRHQSIQAVFEQSWQRLSDEEQRVFSTLSVFSGGFLREAAAAVAGVSTRVLAHLVDKSMLTPEPNGRYHIHELLRQYAQARLKTNPEELLRGHELHAAYYLGFLHEREQDLNGGRQREALLEIEAELDNVRAAWTWAVEHSWVNSIDQVVHPLSCFYAFKARNFEGINAFEKAVQMLDINDPSREIPLAKTLCALGWKYNYADMMEKSQAVAERSWQLYSRHAILPRPGRATDPRVLISEAYMKLRGDFNKAGRLLQSAYQDHSLREDYYNLSWICIYLAHAARWQGRYEAASEHIWQAHQYTVATDDLWTQAFCQHIWGEISRLRGDLADARLHFQNMGAIAKDFGNPTGIARTLQELGRLASLEGDHAEARHCYEQALAIFRDVGNIANLVTTLVYIGENALAQGHYAEARRRLRESLQMITQQPYLAYLTPYYLIPMGELFLQTGQRARGIELLELVLHHPSIVQEGKHRVQRHLDRYQTPEEAKQPKSMNVDFEAIAEGLLDELLIAEHQSLTHTAAQTDEALSEPLSEQGL